MRRVVHVGPTMAPGGMSSVIHTLAANPPEGYRASSCNTYSSKGVRRKIKRWRIAKKQIKNGDFDIVHIHSASDWSYKRKISIAKVAKAPVIFHIHSGKFDIDAKSDLVDYQVVCLSPNWSEKLQHLVGDSISVLNPVDAKLSEGIERENFPTVDGLRASEITFTDVEVSSDNLIGEKDKGFSILQAVVNDAILALSAEAVGAMEVLYKDTVEYTQQREQFDHPLSDFQVLQHRMVDMFMEYEQCKSLLLRATMETVQDPILAQRTVHALKHLIGKSGIFVGESAVQLHGGMGVTEELRIGHFFKRLLVIDSQFGNSDFHLDKFTSL